MCHLRLPCWFQHCLSPTHTTRTITVRWNQYPELRNQSIKKFNNINQSRIHQPLEANTWNRQNLITGGLEELIKKQEKKKKKEKWKRGNKHFLTDSISAPDRRAALTVFSSRLAAELGALFRITTGSQSCVIGPTPAMISSSSSLTKSRVSSPANIRWKESDYFSRRWLI